MLRWSRPNIFAIYLHCQSKIVYKIYFWSFKVYVIYLQPGKNGKTIVYLVSGFIVDVYYNASRLSRIYVTFILAARWLEFKAFLGRLLFYLLFICFFQRIYYQRQNKFTIFIYLKFSFRNKSSLSFLFLVKQIN